MNKIGTHHEHPKESPFEGNDSEIFPKDVLIEIFLMLSPSQITKVQTVNRYWNNVANDNNLWKRLCEIYFAINSEYTIEDKNPVFYVSGKKSSFYKLCQVIFADWKKVFKARNQDLIQKGRNYLECDGSSYDALPLLSLASNVVAPPRQQDTSYGALPPLATSSSKASQLVIKPSFDESVHTLTHDNALGKSWKPRAFNWIAKQKLQVLPYGAFPVVDYFEIEIAHEKFDTNPYPEGMSIGINAGWKQNCHYMMDGTIAGSNAVENWQKTPFGNGDVIGCLWNAQTKEILFTKNGTLLGTAFSNFPHRGFEAQLITTNNFLYTIKTNFGLYPFKFDLKGYVKTLADAIAPMPQDGDTWQYASTYLSRVLKTTQDKIDLLKPIWSQDGIVKNWVAFIAWFSPLSPIATQGWTIDDITTICAPKVFHGFLSAEESYKLFDKKPEGSYVVRFSSQPGFITITEVIPGSFHNWRVKVHKDEEGKLVWELMSARTKYPSLDSLVADKSVLKLQHPVLRKDY